MEFEHILVLVLVVAVSGCISVIGSSQENLTGATEVSVKEVVDGDTVDVRYKDREETIRLDGVDTPEVHTENSPTEYEGIPDTESSRECLRNWGENASSFVKEEIGDENVTLKYELEDGSPERGYYGRIIGELLHENVSINRKLVLEGFARSYSEDGPYIEEERRARQDRTGLWKCRSTS